MSINMLDFFLTYTSNIKEQRASAFKQMAFSKSQTPGERFQTHSAL